MIAPAKRCATCRWWSDTDVRIAAPVRARCLNERSYQAGAYTSARSTCGGWAAGEPVDAEVV